MLPKLIPSKNLQASAELISLKAKRTTLFIVVIASVLLLQACASASKSSIESTSEASWPIVYEPGYQERLAAQVALRKAPSHSNNPNETVIGAVSFAAAVVSIGKDAASQAKVKALADQIQLYAAGESVVVRGYAVNDKGVSRAQQTAHWRAESLYYGLSRAGVPRASMLIETRVADANSGEAGRQAVVVKQR